ncbi:MAG: hypothetical protein AB2805_07465 [Candidatus Thiodiazotropha sp.]
MGTAPIPVTPNLEALTFHQVKNPGKRDTIPSEYIDISILDLLSKLERGGDDPFSSESDNIRKILHKYSNDAYFILAVAKDDFSKEKALEKKVVFCKFDDKEYNEKIIAELGYIHNDSLESECRRVKIGSYNFYYGYDGSATNKLECAQLILSIYTAKMVTKLYISLVNGGGEEYWKDSLSLLLDREDLDSIKFEEATQELSHILRNLLGLMEDYGRADLDDVVKASDKIKHVLRSYTGLYGPFTNFIVGLKQKSDEAQQFIPSDSLMEFFNMGHAEKIRALQDVFNNKHDLFDLFFPEDAFQLPDKVEIGLKIKQAVGDIVYVTRSSGGSEIELIVNDRVTPAFQYSLSNAFNILPSEAQKFFELLKDEFVAFLDEGKQFRAGWGYAKIDSNANVSIIINKKTPVIDIMPALP